MTLWIVYLAGVVTGSALTLIFASGYVAKKADEGVRQR